MKKPPMVAFVFDCEIFGTNWCCHATARLPQQNMRVCIPRWHQVQVTLIAAIPTKPQHHLLKTTNRAHVLFAGAKNQMYYLSPVIILPYAKDVLDHFQSRMGEYIALSAGIRSSRQLSINMLRNCLTFEINSCLKYPFVRNKHTICFWILRTWENHSHVQHRFGGHATHGELTRFRRINICFIVFVLMTSSFLLLTYYCTAN